ncbi:S-methyl-5-thioribose-1-phosphate isomerase [Methylocella tundrae]|uniref:Methylthioribose-1-phosphate isomerase n=1 Tax=Methylocella tundrae TaxID=227605 RepID=A0A4U8YYQ6_METTU|nr:S-methyl-5-thioribose-1-phosphate isomerase [Methylocella tundrae]WPP06114.1 S-methyl-5-thioribose-1-phosphate isomerase [Methylocella tundrae]VFU08726.1 Methylthioribose-1-phosphate isomerase [Methylocella tundrae]
MRVDGKAFTTIWADKATASVTVIDQTRLPHRFELISIADVEAAGRAIKTMQVRGAPLIGITAAYGLALAMRADPSDDNLERACGLLKATRPTAVNLQWALDSMRRMLAPMAPPERFDAAFNQAAQMAQDDIALCEAIGRHGLGLIKGIAARKPRGASVNILTHCNAGWLATVDWGTATAPIYKAQEAGLEIHVFVDETRPRNQGAALTAWELGQHGVPHTVIVDNAGGHLMQHGEIDLVIVGTDRTTATGDVCNKIGTYLKALAASDNHVPFYVAAPSPSIDFSISDGLAEIPIEIRAQEEVSHIFGLGADGDIHKVRLIPQGSGALNPAFDVTPARLVTGLITERGVIAASREALAIAFPERIRA